MSKNRKHDDVDYDALSRAVESGNYSVRGPIESGATLRMGRPAKNAESAGKSPGVTTRFPPELRAKLTAQAEAENTKESELVRKAVAEYLARREASAASIATGSALAALGAKGLGTEMITAPNPLVMGPAAGVIGGIAAKGELSALYAHGIRELLEHIAASHPSDFKLKETTNPDVIEAHGLLDLDEVAEHITSSTG
ncbi:hypothetical protein L2K20_06140 [Mycobacterium sp. MBM]|nr:hypothetical protein [Mycobacterium sp. MBM]